MFLFKKKLDPSRARRNEINREIEELEEQIKRMEQKTASFAASHPPLPTEPEDFQEIADIQESESRIEDNPPIVEETDQEFLNEQPERSDSDESPDSRSYSRRRSSGLRKTLSELFRGNQTGNSKLVSYLASGSIQGLPQLRYEKRVARNRFLGMVFLFLVALWFIYHLISVNF